MSKRLLVQVIPTAAEQIREVVAWWGENSDASILLNALEQAFELLSHQPFMGTRSRNAKLSDVRRLHLRRVRYHLYYRVVESQARVEILALWHTTRGAPPPMP